MRLVEERCSLHLWMLYCIHFYSDGDVSQQPGLKEPGEKNVLPEARPA